MLSSLHGMGADQILSVDLVLADGTFVTASLGENRDLFWAVRGGGAVSLGMFFFLTLFCFFLSILSLSEILCRLLDRRLLTYPSFRALSGL